MIAVAVRTVAHLAGLWAFTTDDAYISLRYARNLVAGHGLLWNPGETPPVEGYSNFLFVLLGAGLVEAGLDPVVALKLVGAAALLATTYILYRLARRWLGPVGSTLPALALTANAGVLWWSASGLETAVYQLLVAGALLCFLGGLGCGPVETSPVSPQGWRGAEQAERSLVPSRLAASGALVFLASLTRPEGPLIGVALGLCLAGHLGFAAWRARRAGSPPAPPLRSGLKAAVVFAASAGLPYLLYTGWRVAHFGRWLPNSVLCKAWYDGDPWILLRQFWDGAALYLVLALVHAPRNVDVRLAVLWSVPALYAVALYGVDPIVAHHDRHFLAAFALVIVAAAVALVELLQRLLPRLPRPRLELALALAAAVGTTVQAAAVERRLEPQASSYADRMATRRVLAGWLERRLQPQDSYLIGDAGLVPYLTGGQVLDAYCLNNGEATRPTIERSPAWMVGWAYGKAPRFLVVPSARPDLLVAHDFYGVFPALAADPALARQYRHVITIAGPAEDTFHYWVFERVAATADGGREGG
jgi:hypothetical protein